MYTRYSGILAIVSIVFLSGCQGHLPDLETSPDSSGPSVADVTNHIQCELAAIVNTKNEADTASSRLKNRIEANGNLPDLLPHLVMDHFVATAQLTLEVTDTEGLAPSLSFINAGATMALGFGAQSTGTQDRSLTINYSVDLAHLKTPDFKKQFCGIAASDSDRFVPASDGLGIAGDLGLADIVADGLTALDATKDSNLYSSAGPAPAAKAQAIDLSGKIVVPEISAEKPGKTLTISGLKGTILFAPQSAGTLTQGSVTLTGVATVDMGGGEAKFVVNWSGSIVPPNSNADGVLYFSLSGNFAPAPGGQGSAAITLWGFNPTVTLTGTIDRNYTQTSLNIAGILSPTPNPFPKPIAISLSQPVFHAAAGGAPSAKGSSASAGSAGGTSFGSLVSFSLIAGANGGPNWTFKRFKGPANGSSSLFSLTHTNIDSLSITFVPACQDYDKVPIPSGITNYWQSIGACDTVGTAQLQSAGVGYENNSLMILKNLIVRP